MQELLQRVLAVLENVGAGDGMPHNMNPYGRELGKLKRQVEKVLDSGVFVGRVTDEDLLDVPGAH